MEGGGLEGEKKKPSEGENKVKRKMKTALQVEILKKTYAVEMHPSESLRADLSVKLGLSDRQFKMWFCHTLPYFYNLSPLSLSNVDKFGF